MKTLRIIARVLMGMLFIFSGYVKVVDPTGSAIKFGEYFEAFSMHAFIPAALAFGILLAVAELVMGLCLLFGIRMKVVAWGALLFMLFMTGLTFVLAMFNPVEDCGCFGDAIKLTNWQTFFKNVIILPFIIFIFVQRKNYIPFACCAAEWAMIAGLVIFSSGVAVYAYQHLPLIDFMAYKVGVNIPAARVMPEGAEPDVYDNTFIYKKDGVEKEFKIDNLPDSTWQYVDTKQKIVKRGYAPPAKDFSISDSIGYVTDSILSIQGYMVFITSPAITKASLKNMEKMNALYGYCQQKSIAFMLLSGSATEDNNAFFETMKSQYPVYHTDETVLKSMVRSNPGMMLLKDGTILKKWNYNDFPVTNEFEKLLSANPDEIIKKHATCERNTTAALLAAVLLLFGVIAMATKMKKS